MKEGTDVKNKNNGDILVQSKFSPGNIFKIAVEMVLGFLFASINVFGAMPFGLAFCSLCTPFGVVGVFLSYFFKSSDSLRYTIAAFTIFILKQFILPRISIPNGIKVTLSVLWGTLFAEIVGAFIYDYTFKENFDFAICGLFACLFSFIFENAKTEEDKNFKVKNQKLFFICYNLTLAIFFFGIMSLGKIFENVAFILAIFTVFCVSDRHGFLKTSTTAAILGFAFWIFNVDYSYFFAMMILGGLLSSLLKEIHKYAIVAAFAIANALMVMFTQGDPTVFFMLINVLLAGTLFIMLPDNAITIMMKYISPEMGDRSYKLKKKNPKTAYRKVPVGAVIDVDKEMKNVCNKCKKRIGCWVKDYSYTCDMFSKIKNSSSSFTIPEHFEAICPYTTDLLRISKKDSPETVNHKIITSKISVPKQGEAVCGDCGGCFSTSDRKFVLCITDGMGTGEMAAKQSFKGSNILRKLIDNGVEKADAIKVVNEMLLKSKDEIIMGIDLAVIDLMNGNCESFKAGAAPTFIVRNGNAFEIGSASLPIGMLEETNFEYNKYRLVSGDYIVMISDGFLSLGTKWIAEFLRNKCVKEDCSCLDITNGITAQAKHMKIQAKDDLTVIAARLV